MDINKWKEYEQKKKELKKQKQRKIIFIWLIWFVIVSVGLFAIIFLRDMIGLEISLVIAVVFIGFSVVIALNKTGEYIKALKEQEILLEQDEPFGRFNT